MILGQVKNQKLFHGFRENVTKLKSPDFGSVICIPETMISKVSKLYKAVFQITSPNAAGLNTA